MIFHVLPGDSLVEEFKKTIIDGKIIVCREALISGPIDAESLDEFWDQRARYILAAYGEDEIEYHDRVAAELNRLTELTPDDEVNLWFEYELFCSVNMWFCLSLLAETGASIFRVEPLGLDEAERWEGFSRLNADDLKACFALRTLLNQEDVEIGTSLWDAYRKNDHAALIELARPELPCFPHVNEVAAAAVERDIQPIETLKAIISGGERDFQKIFAEFKKRDGVYGYGDLQVQHLLDHISS